MDVRVWKYRKGNFIKGLFEYSSMGRQLSFARDQNGDLYVFDYHSEEILNYAKSCGTAQMETFSVKPARILGRYSDYNGFGY